QRAQTARPAGGPASAQQPLAGPRRNDGVRTETRGSEAPRKSGEVLFYKLAKVLVPPAPPRPGDSEARPWMAERSPLRSHGRGLRRGERGPPGEAGRAATDVPCF